MTGFKWLTAYAITLAYRLTGYIAGNGMPTLELFARLNFRTNRRIRKRA